MMMVRLLYYSQIQLLGNNGVLPYHFSKNWSSDLNHFNWVTWLANMIKLSTQKITTGKYSAVCLIYYKWLAWPLHIPSLIKEQQIHMVVSRLRQLFKLRIILCLYRRFGFPSHRKPCNTSMKIATSNILLKNVVTFNTSIWWISQSMAIIIVSTI